MDTQKARCAECRTEVAVPSSYAHGDHIKCSTCGTRHKVVRTGEAVRLVLADIGPLKDALRANETQLTRLEAELRMARASFGIGVNGVGIGVAYAIWQLGFKDGVIGMPLLWEVIGVAVGSGVLLELANHFFLAKRKVMSRLSGEIDESRAEARVLQQKIRESSRFSD
jgi:DNA-directed RNA polymerase subunit RPC12/RpoP